MCIDLARQDTIGFPPTFSDCGFTEGFADYAETPHWHPLTDSNFDTYSDYYGLPSRPISVYRTGERWKRPTGLEAYRVPKELRPICEHPIADVWRELGQQVYQYLDSVNVQWTTIDPVRFAEVEEDPGPLFLWVGVKPGSLSRENAEVAVVGCKKILEEFNFIDVEIAFRESAFTRSTGPRLLDYAFDLDPTVDIAARHTPCFEGTGGLYICEGGESQRIFVLTARHVVLPPNAVRNELYVHKTRDKRPGQRRREVLLLGSKRYQGVLVSIMAKIGNQALMIDYYKNQLQHIGEASKNNDAQAKVRKYFQGLLETAEESIETLNEFHTEVTKSWSIESQRVLGHIVLSPPISVGIGPKLFTEDWALIELHDEKIDWTTFMGNGIDLGTKMSPGNFMFKIFGGVVEENELRHPTMLDANGEKCLIVVKSGNSTGVTLGRATGIMSFVREYFEDGTHKTSMELPIYPYGHKDGAFSAPGDSGSIIADGKGRIVGLLTGGTGKGDSTDVAYASPFFWLFNERIKSSFPNAHLYPIKA
ncbi:hypothetical protein H4582DRAFT_2146717 [Lactarius indigo]|nr:hypothetical protein H4582DRAFT_2146717 [Lactarius indigo]